MRQIKFRAWDKQRKLFVYLTLSVSGFEQKFSPNDDVMPFGRIEDWEQYTNHKDKKGKEIYEGDVVRDYGADGNHPLNYTVRSMKWDYPSYQKQCEVIGNKFENPELTKEVR